MLEIAYILLSLMMLSLIFIGFVIGVRKTNPCPTKKITAVLIGLILWFSYQFLLSKTNVLIDFSLPPKFPILIFLPITIFLIVLYSQAKKHQWIHAIPVQFICYLQSFRVLVELLLYYTFLKGLIPIEATFEGYNFDVIFGLSAIPVGYYFTRKSQVHRSFLYFWNILGIAMVLFVAFIIGSSVYFPQLWGYTEPAVSSRFLRFPYLLIPGFLAPTAIFLHVVALMQLKK